MGAAEDARDQTGAVEALLACRRRGTVLYTASMAGAAPAAMASGLEGARSRRVGRPAGRGS